jgi:hypothetical protein
MPLCVHADRQYMPNDTDFLAQVLLERVRQSQKTRSPETTLDYAISAAVAPDAERRAWLLVSLAARLRHEKRHQDALDVLDAAVAFSPSWEARAAAFTTAAAIHCDLGDLDTARSICDETLAEGTNRFILGAAVRVYWELFRSTKVQEFHDRWQALSAALADVEMEAVAQG